MLESSNLADSLCALNEWDRRSLRLHALELGLRNHQLDVVEPALLNLDRDQQLIGAQLLFEHINGNTVSDELQERAFLTRLVTIGLSHFLLFLFG